MDQPLINYVDYQSILVVNPTGQMRQLFTPFKVQVIEETSLLKRGTWVWVEEINPHPEFKLIYRIGYHWWPYYCFRLSVLF